MQTLWSSLSSCSKQSLQIGKWHSWQATNTSPLPLSPTCSPQVLQRGTPDCTIFWFCTTFYLRAKMAVYRSLTFASEAHMRFIWKTINLLKGWRKQPYRNAKDVCAWWRWRWWWRVPFVRLESWCHGLRGTQHKTKSLREEKQRLFFGWSEQCIKLLREV